MKQKWMCWLAFFLGIFFWVLPVSAKTYDSTQREVEEETVSTVGMELESEKIYEKWQERFLQELNLTEVQKMIDDALEEHDISVLEMTKSVMKGELPLSKEIIQEILYRLFFLRLNRERTLLSKIILLILIAAIFYVFTEVFENGQMGSICFYMVYLLLFIFLADNFSNMSRKLLQQLLWVSDFMKVLAPAYYMTVAAATGVTTATMFYQGVLFLVLLIQWGLGSIVLPCTNLYVLLMFVNHLSKEEMVNKFAELLHVLIGWILKSFMGIVIGLQVVRGLVVPAVDSLKRGAIGKTASVIPGIGNVVNTASDLILTCAILIRNSFGVVVLIILVLFGLEPMIHYLVMSFAYRFLAAVAQPVSDKRIVACLGTMGEGCMLLLRVFFQAEFLCIVTFLILMMSLGGV